MKPTMKLKVKYVLVPMELRTGFENCVHGHACLHHALSGATIWTNIEYDWVKALKRIEKPEKESRIDA